MRYEANDNVAWAI